MGRVVEKINKEAFRQLKKDVANLLLPHVKKLIKDPGISYSRIPREPNQHLHGVQTLFLCGDTTSIPDTNIIKFVTITLL